MIQSQLSAIFAVYRPTKVGLRSTVVRNIDSFERELLRYGYDAIHLQYRDILYVAMYHAITNRQSYRHADARRQQQHTAIAAAVTSNRANGDLEL